MSPPPCLERLRRLGYPVADDGTMRLPPLPRRAIGATALHLQFEFVERLSPVQRVRAMYRGELTYTQLCRWASRHPDEVAVLDGEFIFITVGLPDIAEAIGEHHIIALPELSLAA